MNSTHFPHSTFRIISLRILILIALLCCYSVSDLLAEDTALALPLTEDFSGYQGILSDKDSHPEDYSFMNLNPLFKHDGWSFEEVYPFWLGAQADKTGALLGIETSDTAYLSTPALDLDQAFQINFKFRARQAVGINPDGRFFIYLDNDQLIWEGQTNVTGLQARETEAFIGSSTSRVSFTAPNLPTNQMIVDDIEIIASTKTALNFALDSKKDLGGVQKETIKTFALPLKASNLVGDVTLSLEEGVNFSLVDGNSIPKATAEAGADIPIKFTAPAEVGDYSDKLIIRTDGVVDRVVSLKAESTLGGSGVKELFIQNIRIENRKVSLINKESCRVILYNAIGVKLQEINHTSDYETLIVNQKGTYILQLFDGNILSTIKIFVP